LIGEAGAGTGRSPRRAALHHAPHHAAGGRKEDFSARYCDRRLVPLTRSAKARDTGRKRWDNSGGVRLAELHGLLRREVMVRRLKSQVRACLLCVYVRV
jgi:hypothetical protein